MKNQKGQVLLIVVMLLATAITVVLSISFTTTTDTKITKLEEESQKALAAAEAGIEAALQNKNTVTLSELPGLTGFTGSADLTSAVGKEFASPLLQQDEQYTFYLDDFVQNSAGIFEFKDTPYSSNEFTVYYGNDSVACLNVVLELTLIYKEEGVYKLERFIADADGGVELGSDTNNIVSPSQATTKVGGTSFNCKTKNINIASYPGAKLLIVRTLFNQTKIGFKGPIDLKPQGSFITSTATSTTGVTKKVQLFQSYPQIPSEFFVTRF